MVIREGLIVYPSDHAFVRAGLGSHSSEAEVEAFLADQPDQGFSLEPGEPFDELYLQLFNLELDKETEISDWVAQYGSFRPHSASVPRIDGPEYHPYPALQWYPLFDSSDEHEEFEWFARVVERESDELRSAAGYTPEYLETEHMARPVTVEEFRWAVRCIRDLARTYWCLSSGADPADLEWENPLIAENLAKHGDTWWDEWSMREFLSDTLQEGLAGFSPRLIDEEVAARRGRARNDALSEQFSASTDLFAVCCLELFNHVAEKAVYKTCANETCGRWFVRQQGRAVHDQHRSRGVKFCSYRCARAHTQREYNRRRRRERALRAPADS